MVTASGRAGRKTPATPHASAAAPITTASVSRTAERPGRIRERLPARAGYIFGAGHFDSNSVAHTVGQTLAPSLIVPLPHRRRRSEERRVGKECRSRWSPYH